MLRVFSKRWRTRPFLVFSLAIIFLSAVSLVYAQEKARTVTASGFVFLDENENGNREADEPGLGGILVSDGEEVVRSGDEGSYEFLLDADEIRFITITRPTGYRPTGDWFYRILPEDKETKYNFNFGLKEEEVSRNPDFSFLTTGDSQFRTKEEQLLLIEEFREITRMAGEPGFFFIAGDLTMNGKPEELHMYKEAAEQFTIPCYNIFGGHDGNFTRNTENFKRILGPDRFSWDYGGRHFVAFVTETHYLSQAAKERQERWLEADINSQPPGTEIILISHIPIDNSYIDRLSKKYKIRAYFYGHYHDNAACAYRGIPYLLTGPIRGRDWGAFTRTFRICSFKGDDFRSELRVTGQEHRLWVASPADDTEINRGGVPLIVLAYNTTSRLSEVKFEMKLPDGATRGFANLIPTGGWTWRGSLDLSHSPPGEYGLTAVAKYEDGTSRRAESRFFLKDAWRPEVKVAEDWPGLLRSLKAQRRAESALIPPLQVAWCSPTFGYCKRSSPIIYQGRLYIGVASDEAGWPQAGICSFDAKTGEMLWKTKVDSSIRYYLSASEGKIYGLSSMGIVYALNAQTGEIIWKTGLYPQPPSRTHRLCQTTPVAYKDKILVLADEGPLYVLESRTGEIEKRISVHARNIKYSSPFVSEDKVYIAARDATACYDLETGKEIWKTPTEGTRVVATPIREDGVLYQNGGRFYAFSTETGEVLWKRGVDTGSYGILPPVYSEEIVYGGGRKVAALDARSGEKIWEFEVGQDEEKFKRNKRQRMGGMSAPIISGDLIYFGSDDGYLYALDKKTGERIWQYYIGLPIKSSPVISGNALFVADYDGNLWCLVGRYK